MLSFQLVMSIVFTVSPAYPVQEEFQAFLECVADKPISYYAYQIIRQLNKELSGMGLITVPGRVDANYFKKKLFYEEK